MSADTDLVIFIDTNILVYAFDRSAGQKHTSAAALVRDCWENGRGCISIQVLQEFFVTVTRKIQPALDLETARQIISDLGAWQVHSPQTGDLLQAIDLQEHFRLSVWDAMIVQSALRLGCSRLYSEDLSHTQRFGGVQVINPFLLPDVPE